MLKLMSGRQNSGNACCFTYPKGRVASSQIRTEAFIVGVLSIRKSNQASSPCWTCRSRCFHSLGRSHLTTHFSLPCIILYLIYSLFSISSTSKAVLNLEGVRVAKEKMTDLYKIVNCDLPEEFLADAMTLLCMISTQMVRDKKFGAPVRTCYRAQVRHIGG